MSPRLLKEQLVELSRGYDRLPEADEPPPTTLQVLGRSRREVYWQRILVHFLTPDAAHGLGNAVLEHFLSALSSRSDLKYQFSRLELEDIKIEEEVSTSIGRPDLVLWSPERWFLCFELKVDSSEGDDQTQRYVEAQSFDGIGVDKSDIPGDRHQYVYLAPMDAPSPVADEFVHISWEWVASELQSFLSEDYGEYPFRTTVQMNDFVDTIRSELTMTDHQENRQEKVELAIEHYEAMSDVLETLEEYVEDLQNRWPDWFLEKSPTGWDNSWIAPESGNSYLKAYRDEWTIDFDTDSISSSGLFVYWEFRITDRHLGQNNIDHRIIVTGEDEQLLEQFRERFYSESTQRQVAAILTDVRTDPEKEIALQSWDGHTYERVIDGKYRFEFRNGDGVSEAVVEAFEDLEPVFDIVSESIPKK